MRLKSVILLVLLALVFSFNLCLAEDWELITSDNKYADITTIKNYVVNNSLLVTTADVKFINDNGDYDIYRLYINIDDFKSIKVWGKSYHANGELYNEFSNDPNDKSLWNDCSKDYYLKLVLYLAQYQPGNPVDSIDDVPR